MTRAMTSGPSWRRTSRGFFAPATEVELTSTQRILDVVPLVPSGGALAGWTAAYRHGVDALDGLDPFSMQPLPVDICLGSGSGRRNLDHARYSRDRLPEDHRVVRHGLPVTSGLRTAFDGGRWARSLTEAVVFVDQVAHALQLEPSSVGELVRGPARMVARHPPARGGPELGRCGERQSLKEPTTCWCVGWTASICVLRSP
ncbi:MAG TPA: hypothetical protein VIT42_19215 [Microlunatus sp.]